MTLIKIVDASPGIRNLILTVLVSLCTLVITRGLELSLCLLNYRETVNLFRGLDGD